jgi:hypothetical protein
MNRPANSKISRIKDEWMATTIAYLFPKDFSYWAPDSRSGKCRTHFTQPNNKAGKRKAEICHLLKAN